MKYDAIIIGFGKAGKTLAGSLAKQGKKVALIEKSQEMYGGTCINVGCIPTKSLVHSAEFSARYGDESKGDGEELWSGKASRYHSAIAEKHRLTSLLRGKNYRKLADLEQVTIYDGEAHFQSNTVVEIALTKGGNEVLEGEKIFINTGATLVVPNIPGLEHNPNVYFSDSLMEEDKLPRRLTLIGAGYIGMEFASMYSKFGAQVTVLQDGDTFLPREDRDVADAIQAILEKQGVNFLFGAKTLEIEDATVVYEQDGVHHRLDGDAILVATGRRANTDGLQAEKAGVELTPRGAIKVDEKLKTTAPNIWAMGDVNGGPQFTFVSLDDYRIVFDQLRGREHSVSERNNVPYSVFMDTPLGRVGITEKQANDQNIPVRVMKLPTAAIPKAQVLKKTEGFLKAIVHAETGKILGAALLCPEAYEMINTVKLAMDMGADYTMLRDQIYTHPTMTEAFNDLFAM